MTINLQNLPYPMFKLSKKDKQLLDNCLQVYHNGHSSQFLCITLIFHIGELESTVKPLIRKIEKSLKGCATLNTYLAKELLDNNLETWDSSENLKLREIWIEKLLAQTGDKV